MSVYSVSQVERLLRHYLDIRYMLDVQPQRLHDTYAVRFPTQIERREQPFGMKQGDQRSWPFHEPRHARPPRDGKAKARFIEELHVSILDIERALREMSDDDLELIYKYHIFQTHTLDDLLIERHVSSRGSMQQRVFRAVQRLTKEMERTKHES